MKNFKHIYLMSIMLCGSSAFGMTSHLTSALQSGIVNGARQVMLSRPGVVGGFLGCTVLAFHRYYSTKNNAQQKRSLWERIIWCNNPLPHIIPLNEMGNFLQKCTQFDKYEDFMRRDSLKVEAFSYELSDAYSLKWVEAIISQQSYINNLVFRIEKNDNKIVLIIDDKCGCVEEVLGGLKKKVSELSAPIQADDLGFFVGHDIFLKKIISVCEAARQQRLANINEWLNREYSATFLKFFTQTCLFPYLTSFSIGSCAAGLLARMIHHR
jgi:hypothetical protein